MTEVKKRNKYLHKKVNKSENINDEGLNNESTYEYMEPTNPKWYEEIPKEPAKFPECKESEVISLRSEAEIVLKKEEETYNKKASHNGNQNQDKAWLRTVMSKGTAADKVAAYVITIQDAPVCNLTPLRNLVNMVKVSKKKECMVVMQTLTELFNSDLLKPGRKLCKFEQQPLSLLNELTSGNAVTRKKYLSHWIFEDHLKNLYAQFVHALDIVSKDTVDAHREKAVTAMYKLLSRNPEQEEVLLRNLVNKLGDPYQKVVSKVIYCLTQLLRVHPVMKKVVANEIERFLFRSNIGSRAQYYAICFLSQYLYSSDDTELAEKIIHIYFSFFKANIKKGDIDSRMMGALLMGVNRAYPFARLEQHELSEHVDTLYKLVHISTFNISLQTLCLLYQIVGNSTDRFYSALYKKLLDPHLALSAHQAMFINLVYKALRQDTNIDRVKVFIKRLLQVCLNCPSQLACGLLFLVSQLITKRSQLLALITHKQKVFKEDDGNSDSDSEEHYKDVPIDVDVSKETNVNGEENSENESGLDVDVKDKLKLKPGWVHCQNIKPKVGNTVFDSQARNPAHARGCFAAYEELTVLSNHYHPTVALFARNILDKQQVKYSGDPLQDFTLLRFLERFVFKNPKQLAADSAGRGPDPCLAQRRHYAATGPRALAINSDTFLQRGEDKVPVDELFLYRYLQTKKTGSREKIVKEEKKKPVEDDESDIESVASDEFNEMLDKMVGKIDDDLDFADDVGDKLKSNKKKSKSHQKESESDSEEDMSEDGVDIDEDEELTDLEDEEGSDEEAIDFGEEGEDFEGDIDLDNLDSEDENDDFEEETTMSKSKKNNFKNKGIHTMFAPAEKFAEMLEETGASRLKVGTAHDVSNKDNAALKQLEWEAKRNWAQGGKRKRFNEGSKRPSFNKGKRKKY